MIAGDETAYERLYIFYYKKLLNYGRKFTHDLALLEDAVQEALILTWERRRQLEKVRLPQTYLFSIFRNTLFKSLHRIGKHRLSPPSAHAEPEFGIEHILVSLELEQETKQRLQKAIQNLTNRQREAIFLRFYEGLSYEEVAAVLGISTKATYKIMSRALVQLKETLSLPLFTLLLLLRSTH